VHGHEIIVHEWLRGPSPCVAIVAHVALSRPRLPNFRTTFIFWHSITASLSNYVAIVQRRLQLKRCFVPVSSSWLWAEDLYSV